MTDPSQELALSFDSLSEAEQQLHAKHNGRYVEERNPKLAAAIRLAVRCGISHEMIVQELNVSHALVAALAQSAKPISMETHKREIISGLQRLSQGLIRRMNEMIDNGEEIPFQAAMISLGIAVEKEQLLQGAPTQRVEHTEAPEVTAFRQLLLQQAQRRGMVLPVGNLDSKAGDSARLPSGPVIDVEGDS